jgi:thiamine-monophosphate kinase
LSEFSLIEKYFTRTAPTAVLGVGDDAALIGMAPGISLAVSTDMLVGGTHFFADADPYLLGRKTLAVNISDMAAMGATPRWATLSLALPEENAAWLAKFSKGFFAMADAFGVELVGGDTTRGPLNLCVTIMGVVPQGKALRRDGAKAGDEIWVSGHLGDAALALAHLQGKLRLEASAFKAVAPALHDPQPRVALGQVLRGIAHSAIDISDGLLADLGHILERSRLGAEIHVAQLPLSEHLRPYAAQESGLRFALAGGDDYELCFTASAKDHQRIAEISEKLTLPLTCIGNMVAGSGCKVLAADNSEIKLKEGGYDHFA